MASQLKNLSAESDVNELWAIYKTEFKKSYGDEEDKTRFEIFQGTVKQIIEHNEKFAKGEVTFSMGLNQFADRGPNEPRFGGVLPKK